MAYDPAFNFSNRVLEGEKFSTYWQRAFADLLRGIVASSSRRTGVTIAVATGTNIAHGLQRVPAFVIITPQDAGPTNPYVSNIGETTFRINYGGGGTHVFGWIAET